MPEFGRLRREDLPASTPFPAPLYPPPPWPLPGARILQLSFEIDRDTALHWLPTSLSRPTPPYANILIADYPESPVGPFGHAQQLIVCRSSVRARGFPLQTVASNPAALAALRELWGFPARPGRVSIEDDGEHVQARLETPDGRLILRAAMRYRSHADPAFIHYDPALCARLIGAVQGERPPTVLELVQVDPGYMIRDARLGDGVLEYGEPGEGYPWRLLASQNLIATTFTISDTELPLARYVEDL